MEELGRRRKERVKRIKKGKDVWSAREREKKIRIIIETKSYHLQPTALIRQCRTALRDTDSGFD